ncbi:helix-turn-helix transcriptional regulator [Amphritea sp.]|uniref:helix-turn-helix transcriptional regulator n=1 Tax=Amphritea sp. TaxID=1872502 RepID=UPI003D106BA4
MQVPLISNNEIKELFDLSAQAVDSLGCDELPIVLSRICEYISAYDTMMVYAFVKDEVPQPLFNNFKIKEINNCWVPYFEGAYLLDPFYELSKQKVDDGFYHLRDIAPDDFFESEYFNSFFRPTRLRDETTLIVNLNENVQVHLSLGLRDNQASLTTNDLHRLDLIAGLLIALTRSHWPDIKPDQPQGIGRVGAHLENAFSLFGSSCLSERECEIVRYILRGHSSKSIARLLDISPETVKVYRKRVHQKLDITSHGELFSIFLKCLKTTPVGSTADPLTFIKV